MPYYDCRIWTRGQQPMTFCDTNRRRVVREMRKLLSIKGRVNPRGFHLATIRVRPTEVILEGGNAYRRWPVTWTARWRAGKRVEMGRAG